MNTKTNLSQAEKDKIVAQVLKRRESEKKRQAKTRAAKKALGMRSVTLWVPELPEDQKDNYFPIVVYALKADYLNWKGKIEEGIVPHLLHPETHQHMNKQTGKIEPLNKPVLTYFKKQ